MKTELLDRNEYKNANGLARWWQKDGAWHIARPEKSEVTGKLEMLWQPGEYNTREEAVAALQ